MAIVRANAVISSPQWSGPQRGSYTFNRMPLIGPPRATPNLRTFVYSL
jgi:hypothetical protein